MKTLLTGLTAFLLVLTIGCKDKSNTQSSSATNATGGSVVTAPVDYLSAVAKAQQKAVKTIDTTSLDKAVQLFNVDHGRNPTDLNELVKEKYIAELPSTPYGTKLNYDSVSGRVTVVKQ